MTAKCLVDGTKDRDIAGWRFPESSRKCEAGQGRDRRRHQVKAALPLRSRGLVPLSLEQVMEGVTALNQRGFDEMGL